MPRLSSVSGYFRCVRTNEKPPHGHGDNSGPQNVHRDALQFRRAKRCKKSS
jgi:hypothetical protein